MSSWPHSSANSTLCMHASLNPTCTARPATNAAMNMLAADGFRGQDAQQRQRYDAEFLERLRDPLLAMRQPQ